MAPRWRHIALVCTLLAVVVWLASGIAGLLSKARIAVSEARQARAQYEALEERRVHLEASLAALGTDRGRDAAIRTAFGVARPGEEVIVVVPPIPATTTPAVPWWKKILNWF